MPYDKVLKQKKKQGSQLQGQTIVATQKATLSAEAEKMAKKLATQGAVPPDDQFKLAWNFARALGISFLGHKSHGSNFSLNVDGVAIMQNVVDGMTKSPKKTQIIDGIFNACGVRLQETTK